MRRPLPNGIGDFRRAIIARPEDNTTRLAFADWLDENGPLDRDHATAEHIRLAITTPRKVSTWLTANAWRLCPTLAGGIIGPGRRKGAKSVYVDRSVIYAGYDPPWEVTEEDHARMHSIRFQLHFDRGLCTLVRWGAVNVRYSIYPLGAYATLARVLCQADHYFARFEQMRAN